MRPQLSANIAVVGSINADFIASVADRPQAGETTLAVGFDMRSGGKGGNQAVAAARSGAQVAFIGAVGDDSLGVNEINELRTLGIDVSAVAVVPGETTGMAFITVTPNGENSIVVAPGANRTLDAETVLAGLCRTATPDIVVLQSEISPEAIDAAAAWAAERNVRVIFNNGPCVDVEPATLRAADPLVVNEHEARELCVHSTTLTELALVVRARTGARSVIVTLGAQGILVDSPDESMAIPATLVSDVVDTTGAGDAFVGALAAALARGTWLTEAARLAAAAAAASVSWTGARQPASRNEEI